MVVQHAPLLKLCDPYVAQPIARTALCEPCPHSSNVVRHVARLPVVVPDSAGELCVVGQRDHHVVLRKVAACVEQALGSDSHGLTEPRHARLCSVDGNTLLCPTQSGWKSIQTTC